MKGTKNKVITLALASSKYLKFGLPTIFHSKDRRKKLYHVHKAIEGYMLERFKQMSMWSDLRQMVVRSPSDGRQISVRWSSDLRQMVVRSPSDGRQISVRWSSDLRQMVVRSPSDGRQISVK